MPSRGLERRDSRGLLNHQRLVEVKQQRVHHFLTLIRHISGAASIPTRDPGGIWTGRTRSAWSAWSYGICMAGLPLPTPPLADDAIVLRPWRETDIPAQLRIFSDPVFQAFSDWAPRTEAAARRALVEYEAARRRGEQAEFALVASDDDDVVLGGGSLNNVTLTQGRAAIGYWLAPEARDRGVAVRAVRLLARWAFDDLGIARLELTCGPDNTASQRVAERCGFTREGVLRSHMPFKGARRDTVMFSLLPGEFRQKRCG
jgi:RimJ/RimL family protein N-acetyltransferase